MANFSNYLERALLGVSLCGSSFTAPSTVYISLATSLNSDGDSYTEVTTNIGYARKPALFVAPTSGPAWRTYLASNVTFDAATSPWGTVTHVAIYDSATIGAGNMLYWGALSSSRAVQTNDVVELALGSSGLTVELD